MVLAALLALALSGCGGQVGTTPERDAHGRYVIHMTAALSFSPAIAHVPLNATVVWVNDSPQGHDVSDGTFASGKAGGIPPGGNYTFTFSEAGTFEYYCYVHHGSGMTGKVVVG